MHDKLAELQGAVWNYYESHRRPMKWRDEIHPYWVLVSEIMLQQTQVPRVQVKFEEFIDAFPSFEALANASLAEVLQVWQGMGYNRRGKFLWQTAQRVVEEYNGVLPGDPKALETLPGIGAATAGAIACYAYNKPTTFIETNVRRVFLYHLFPGQEGVHDRELMPWITKVVPQDRPRDWYYALMDYGTYLKKIVPNPNRKSKHYTKQSKFEGSNRQVRSRIIKELLKSPQTQESLEGIIGDDRVAQNIDALLKEGMICSQDQLLRIA